MIRKMTRFIGFIALSMLIAAFYVLLFADDGEHSLVKRLNEWGASTKRDIADSVSSAGSNISDVFLEEVGSVDWATGVV